jgi:hypothetical protein
MMQAANTQKKAGLDMNPVAKTFGDEDDNGESEAQLLISRKQVGALN